VAVIPIERVRRLVMNIFMRNLLLVWKIGTFVPAQMQFTAYGGGRRDGNAAG
jgi:hypothetical protein